MAYDPEDEEINIEMPDLDSPVGHGDFAFAGAKRKPGAGDFTGRKAPQAEAVKAQAQKQRRLQQAGMLGPPGAKGGIARTPMFKPIRPPKHQTLNF